MIFNGDSVVSLDQSETLIAINLLQESLAFRNLQNLFPLFDNTQAMTISWFGTHIRMN